MRQLPGLWFPGGCRACLFRRPFPRTFSTKEGPIFLYNFFHKEAAHGPGPNTWDKLAPLVDWVENGRAPDFLIATHSTDGAVDNERKICPHPQRAVYTGPAGGENNRANWVQGNFTCR